MKIARFAGMNVRTRYTILAYVCLFFPRVRDKIRIGEMDGANNDIRHVRLLLFAVIHFKRET